MFSSAIFCTRFAHALKKARHFKHLTCGFTWSAGQDLNLRPTNTTLPPGQTLAHACTFCHHVFAAQSRKRLNDVASRLNRLHIFCTRGANSMHTKRLVQLVTNRRECISWRVRCSTILHKTSSRTVTCDAPSSTSCCDVSGAASNPHNLASKLRRCACCHLSTIAVGVVGAKCHLASYSKAWASLAILDVL